MCGVQVSLLLTWGINNGHMWDYAAAGPAGLTVLHLAALLNDGGHVADELTGMASCPPGHCHHDLLSCATVLPLLPLSALSM